MDQNQANVRNVRYFMKNNDRSGVFEIVAVFETGTRKLLAQSYSKDGVLPIVRGILEHTRTYTPRDIFVLNGKNAFKKFESFNGQDIPEGYHETNEDEFKFVYNV